MLHIVPSSASCEAVTICAAFALYLSLVVVSVAVHGLPFREKFDV